jgi:menaquinone-dependent protoporphyrinogen oxidase
MQHLRLAGHQVELADASELDAGMTLGSYDAYIIGASVHQEGHQLSIRNFVTDHRQQLNAKPAAFFSVSLNAALADDWHQQEAQVYVDQFLETTGWQAAMTWLVAGALKNTQYDYFKKQLLHFVKQRTVGHLDSDGDYEFTDWDDVNAFVESFLELLEEAPVA